MYYKVFKDDRKEWRWSLYAANGKIIADSGEGYHNKTDCIGGIEQVKGSSGAPVKE